MQLISDIQRDARHPKTEPGGYEWWYFDGISEDGEYQLVIIYYDGCPFSTRYIRSLEKDTDDRAAMASEHPAISISIYYRGEPVFYSLSQYPADRCRFHDELPEVTIGSNSFRFSGQEIHGSTDYGSYDLRINERLPSGDELKGIITFTGMRPNERLLQNNGMHARDDRGAHMWNLVFPRAKMQCRMNLIRNGLIKKELKFDGTGYHDHNIGREPMKEAFRDWYWGRVHFPQATLVYYVMNTGDGHDHRAWLISTDNRRLLYQSDSSQLKSRRLNGFLMRPARRLIFSDREKEIEVEVQHRKLCDSGPFYCRYLSTARLMHPVFGDNKNREVATGIAEYIRPDRIHKRRYWPLVHMRLRYVDQKPHWVQKSPRLYRRTW